MNLSLPTANANSSASSTPAWVVAVSAQGNYTVNGVRVEGRSAQDIGAALQKLTQADAALVIKADASASHQAVVNVLEAARSLGIAKIAFATQSITNAKAAP